MSYLRRFLSLLVVASAACGTITPPTSGPSATSAVTAAAPDPATGAPPTSAPTTPVYNPGPTPPANPNGANPNTANPNSTNPNSIPAQPYAYVGRFDLSDPNAVMFAWPNSKIGASFTGTTLSVTLADSGTDYFNIVLDGQSAGVVQTNPGTTPVTYPIASNLAAGTHTVWMTKRTEFMQSGGSTYVGITTFYGFNLQAGAHFATPPSTRPRHLDFIGDSAFTGFGAGQVMTPETYCSYTPATQNADLSIPAYTAQILNAEIVNASSSGQGVYQSVYDNNNAHLLPVMYEETVPPSAAPAWNFNQWTADAVIISAGGDDLAGDSGSGTLPDPSAFLNAYVSWLARIRQHYPQALIVVVEAQSAKGTDIATLGNPLQQAVAARVSQGDSKVDFFSYYTGTPYTDYDDAVTALGFEYGCGYHPSPAGALWLAQRLSTFIQSKTGW